MSSNRLTFVGALAFHALMLGCAQTEQTENLLSAAGFRAITVRTPQQQQHLKKLQPYKVVAARRNGKMYYVYANPAHNEIYVGNQFQYDRYRDLRLEKNLAQENLQAAELSDQEPGWDIWGPWRF